MHKNSEQERAHFQKVCVFFVCIRSQKGKLFFDNVAQKVLYYMGSSINQFAKKSPFRKQMLFFANVYAYDALYRVKSKIVCKMGRLETVAPKPFLTPSLCEI
jgi:hypothetical protein